MLKQIDEEVWADCESEHGIDFEVFMKESMEDRMKKGE